MTEAENKRAFLKHKKYGVVKAVEFDQAGYALAGADVNEAICCRHQLNALELTLDAATEVNEHRRDWDAYEAECSDPAHILSEIGDAEKRTQVAESEWKSAQNIAKSRKEIFEKETEALRVLVRSATTPKVMPLFDKPAA